MTNKLSSIIILGAATISLAACKTKAPAAYKTTPNGLDYRIVKDEPGTQKPAVGDYMEFHIKSYVRFPLGDSLLFDSRQMNNNKPVPYQVMPAQFRGDLTEGFMMLTVGDSAIFRVPVDSVFGAGQQTLPWMEKGKGQKVDYIVKVTKLQTKAQREQEQQEAAGKQGLADEELIKAYIAQNKIKATRTPSGLYYKIDKMGTGPLPHKGSSVSMNYTGMTVDGTKFDSNVDPAFNHVQPFEFKLGAGQVIKGWDEGIALLPKGTKGTLYIPSSLAYGPNSPSPQIPPNSVLIFDVEVVDIHDHGAGGHGHDH
jgi:FKBP-type peptidyl-prolyl cis-trans isomerase